MLTRRKFLAATPLALGAAAFAPRLLAAQATNVAPPALGRSTRQLDAARSSVARVTTQSSKGARLLQVTDLHFFNKTAAEDEQTVRDLHRLVELTTPDLVVVTGDLWYNNPNGRGYSQAEHAVKQMGALGVPWAFCWGNHDQLDDYQLGHDLMEGANNSLYRGSLMHGDYRLELFSSREAAAPAADLVFLNSGSQGLNEWQLMWFRITAIELGAKRREPASAFAFFHIPIVEYRTRFAAGANMGLQLEKVCHEQAADEALAEFKKLSALKACFCGHDHLNDYVVRAGGLDLVYGRATGHGGYGGEQLRKGAKLIEIDFATGGYRQATVFADGTRWHSTLPPRAPQKTA